VLQNESRLATNNACNIAVGEI